MNYLYYPGCSLTGTAREYDISTRAVMKELGATLSELEDWTCCGASAAESTSYLLSLALPAMNLAVAEGMEGAGDILAPCSACYLNLKKVNEKIKADKGLLTTINAILAEESLEYRGGARPRHLLDILSMDVGAGPLGEKITNSLKGIKIAPYYGCQCLRPYPVFDDPEEPSSMNPLIEATGAEVFPFAMSNVCCGASHMNTKKDVGLTLTGKILRAAKGADAIVTVCPMCQINLEAHQKSISGRLGEDVSISVLYLPQLLGLGMGLSGEALGLRYNLCLTGSFPEKAVIG